jgi:hypothetical protein
MKTENVNGPLRGRSPSARLTPSLLAALKDCASFRDGYYWKRATMRKLAVLGLVESYLGVLGTAHRLTDAGRAAIASAASAERSEATPNSEAPHED